jgi:energy-coupling factor transporter ATP-binding protein EcfA2
MKLSRFIVRATPGLPDLDLKICDSEGVPLDRGVLVGPSGSGKSRLIGILSALYRLPMAYTRPDGLVGVGYAAAWVDLGSVLYPPHLRPADFRLVVLAGGGKSLHVTPGKDMPVEETAACWTDSEGKSRMEITPRGRARSVGSTVAKMRQSKVEGRGGLLVYPESRDLGKARMEGIKPVETTFDWVWEYKTRNTWTGSVEAWLVWQNYLDLEDQGQGQPGERFEKVAELINSALARSRISGVRRGRVEVCSSDGKPGSYGLDSMSAGERQVVLLLAEACRRVRPGCLLVVDCPELHLDAKAMVSLLEGLERVRSESSAQLLFTTVSRDVVEWFSDDERLEIGPERKSYHLVEQG